MADFIVKVNGLEELVNKVTDPNILGRPIRTFFNRSMMTLIAKIIPYTPADTGMLRGRITDQSGVSIDQNIIPHWAQLKPNVNYTGYVENDTKPHWPPKGSLAGWAHRHHIPEFLVRRKISRFGTKGKHMFEYGFRDAEPSMAQYLNDTARDIEREWVK